MSNKLTFEEWASWADNNCNEARRKKECQLICESCKFAENRKAAWNFAQAQEQKEAQAKQAMYDEEYSELHKANVTLMDERDILRKENDSLWVENEDLTRKLENPAQKIINKQAHDNAIRKLNEANERIVEFEDIKKSHLKIQAELKKKVEELERYISNKSDTIKAYDEYKKTNLGAMISADEKLSQEFDDIFNNYKIFRDREERELKKKLEKAEEVIGFYGDPEKWMIKTSDSWTKSNPKTYGDSELIENYKHPNKDWIGSIVVGGKKARAYLKENEG